MNASLVRSESRPALGGLAWERAGGPPLSFVEKLGVLAGAAVVVGLDWGARVRFWLNPWGPFGPRQPAKVDLGRWAAPDTRGCKAADAFVRRVCSPQMVHHSARTYWFAAVLAELAGQRDAVDHEALYVAALMHDVGLFESPRPPGERCFSVGSAREARQLAKEAGWDEPRIDKVAVAITTNPNPFVPVEQFGLEAHFMRVGGLVDVIAQEWKVHPDNLAEVLATAPRDGFASDSLAHLKVEMKLNPDSRFACLDPFFPLLIKRGRFSLEAPPPR